MKYEIDTDREYLDFSNGVLSYGNWSYQIDSWGSSELNEDETHKLYLAMKEFYESQGMANNEKTDLMIDEEKE